MKEPKTCKACGASFTPKRGGNFCYDSVCRRKRATAYINALRAKDVIAAREKARQWRQDNPESFKAAQYKYRACRCTICGEEHQLYRPKTDRVGYMCGKCKAQRRAIERGTEICHRCLSEVPARYETKRRHRMWGCDNCKGTLTLQQLGDLHGVTRQCIELTIKRYYSHLPSYVEQARAMLTHYQSNAIKRPSGKGRKEKT